MSRGLEFKLREASSSTSENIVDLLDLQAFNSVVSNLLEETRIQRGLFHSKIIHVPVSKCLTTVSWGFCKFVLGFIALSINPEGAPSFPRTFSHTRRVSSSPFFE